MRSRGRVSLYLVLAAANACGSDASLAPGSRADLSQVINELEITQSRFALSWSRPVNPTVPTFIPANCAFAASAQRFDCPTQTIGGVTVSQSYTLLGSSGAPQSAFDAARTAAVRIDVTLAGRFTDFGRDLAVDEQRSLTLSGLLTGQHTVDGESTARFSGTIGPIDLPLNDPGRTSINTVITTTISRLVLPPNVTAMGAPVVFRSGTITINNSTSVLGLPPMVSSAVFPFDGSNVVLVVITVNGVTRTCLVDLVGVTYSTCL
jgi:hypothetical protein